MEEHPERIIYFAVDGMLPQNHLHDKMMKRLKVLSTGPANQGKSAAPRNRNKKAVSRKWR